MRVRSDVVPNFFTMANMFCGYLSTVQSSQENFVSAVWLIVAAAVLDVLDGKLARFTETTTDFGAQYDSLADVVSFGLAPSVLTYFVFFHQWGAIGIFVSFMPLVFGAIRLARFNVNLKETPDQYFIGVPIPAAAIVIATFVTFNFEIWGYLRWAKIYLTLILLVSLLMISNFRYEKMPGFSLQGGRTQRLKIIAVLAGIFLIVLFPQQAFFPLSMAYVFSGVTRALWRLLNPKYEGKNIIEIEDNDK